MTYTISEEWPAAPPAKHYFQVGMARTTFGTEAAEARDGFRRHHAIQIADVLESSLLQRVLTLCAEAEFVGEGAHPGSRETEVSPGRVGRLLNLVLSRAKFLRWLEEASGCAPLHAVDGKLVQTLQRPGDELRWHDDRSPEGDRQLAMVIHLSESGWEGGEFQLRHKNGERLFSHAAATAGTGVIFRVDAALEHRVCPLKSGGPRRVFAGWALSRKEAL